MKVLSEVLVGWVDIAVQVAISGMEQQVIEVRGVGALIVVIKGPQRG